MQKWRAKHGPKATYRNLAKSFYDAGERSLVETVCKVVTHIGSTDSSRLHYSPSQRLWTLTTSQACKYCLLGVIVAVAVAVAGVLSFSYVSGSNHPLNLGSFPSDENAFQIEFGRPLHSQNAEKIAPNDLPYIPGPFVGRDEDVNNITSILFSNDSVVQMVNIVGLPAVGKSTLAIRIGHKMASHGVAVRYINLHETRIFKSHDESKSIITEHHDKKPKEALAITKAFTDITLSSDSHTETRFVSTTAQGLIEWAERLSNVTLLILDNCDSLLQGKKGGNTDFIKVLDALNKASPYLHTLTTSRLKIILLDAKPYELKPLDSESAINLLELLSSLMTSSDSRTVNGLLDGIPLALKIVGNLVSEERPPNLVISQLQQNFIETLTPEGMLLHTQKMYPVLKVSFNYLDSDTEECALYLSHFPGSFSEEAAVPVLNNCANCTPIRCLRMLTSMSLLDKYYYAGDSRYQFHRIIKEYLFDVESKRMPVTVTSMNRLFNSSFLLHYIQALHDFVSTYNQAPHGEENIGRFEHESHNFETLLEKVHYFDQWTVTSVVDLTHALTSDLMLETFTMRKLLKVGQKILITLERRMDEISAQIGAVETLNTYRDLVVALRMWIQSFPESDCKSVCEETFLQQDYETRLQTIDRQLAKANVTARDFYRKLHLSFYGESICLSYCLHFESLDHYMVKITILLLMILNVVRAIKNREFSVLQLLEEEFWLCFGLYTDFSPVISVYIAMLVGIQSSGFSAMKVITHQHHKTSLTVVYYLVISFLLIYATIKHMITADFFFFCIIVHIAGFFRCNIGINFLHVSTSLHLLHTYFYDIETLRYALRCLVSYVNSYWGVLSSFIPYQQLLFLLVNCALILSYYSYAVLYT